MSTLIAQLLPLVQTLRAIPEQLGWQSMEVLVRVRTWSGGQVRLGTYEDQDTAIKPNPSVRETSDGRGLVVDKITPFNAAGGLTYEQINPAPFLTPAQEVLYVVRGQFGERVYTASHLDTSNPITTTLYLTGLERAVPY